MPINWKNNKIASLLKAFLDMKNQAEAKRFLRDLLTEAEIKEFSNRWLAAQMLDQNVSYTIIQSKTGLSTTTIARISSWLQKGTGGYRLMLNRLVNHHHTPSSHHHRGSSFEKGLR